MFRGTRVRPDCIPQIWSSLDLGTGTSIDDVPSSSAPNRMETGIERGLRAGRTRKLQNCVLIQQSSRSGEGERESRYIRQRQVRSS